MSHLISLLIAAYSVHLLLSMGVTFIIFSLYQERACTRSKIDNEKQMCHVEGKRENLRKEDAPKLCAADTPALSLFLPTCIPPREIPKATPPMTGC